MAKKMNLYFFWLTLKFEDFWNALLTVNIFRLFGFFEFSSQKTRAKCMSKIQNIYIYINRSLFLIKVFLFVDDVFSLNCWTGTEGMNAASKPCVSPANTCKVSREINFYLKKINKFSNSISKNGK